MRYIFSVLALLAAITTSQAQPSPQQFLQYQPGTRFTPHFKVMEYFRKVAESVKNVKLETYGETYEGRPLMIAILSSPENMARLEEIRRHAARATAR